MKRLFPILIIPFLVAACGGGGGLTAPTASTDSYQLQGAYVSYITDLTSKSFNISGASNGGNLSGSGRVTSGLLTAATFEGQAVLSKMQVVTGNIIIAGTSIPLSSSRTTYVDGAYRLVGSNGGNEYTVVTSFTMPSDSAKVNTTGNLFSATRYADSTKRNVIGMTTATYALEPETSSTSLLKFSIVDTDTSGKTTSTGTSVFRVTPSGVITPVSESETTSGQTFTITY